MLPRAGIYYFPWEIGSGVVPEGETVRTYGRFHCYDMVRSRVTLVAQHQSVQHQVHVCTKFVEPFQAHTGSLYIVLGEHEQSDDKVSMIKARVLTCVEGMNLPLLEQAIHQQREYQQERELQESKNNGLAPRPVPP
ncbi:CST complex subunit TEN1 [Monodelphis domestica]|uniref:CST complex subunit TEN1 n=1 Tax=Monodelphis domestica TaxID=13616 RepID=K7E4B8_MONDO|nr:CST complex subunit TEN1 [Monodelphis domestica]XP_056673100.1 CST complex subunit TEN1 [Monodelphis domestica]XP_056673101.1 CST complex subunit TEN1 [Monodelphis domestica]XP_056673102.1 CST complex subunit TEN1 [Monodelphis domestica]